MIQTPISTGEDKQSALINLETTNATPIAATAATTTRIRPRTYAYFTNLPYVTETPAERLAHLDHILVQLYTAINGQDMIASQGSGTAGSSIAHWTRELRGWIDLKFDMPVKVRRDLVRVYVELSLAGCDSGIGERAVNMVVLLTKDPELLLNSNPGHIDNNGNASESKSESESELELELESESNEPFYIDHEPLIKEMIKQAIPQSQFNPSTVFDKPFSLMSKLALAIRPFFRPNITLEILEQVLPNFTTAKATISHNTISLLSIVLPVVPTTTTTSTSHNDILDPQSLLPALFHLWQQQLRSSLYDYQMLDLVSRYATDCIKSPLIDLSATGIFTPSQLNFIFSQMLKLLAIPVSNVGSPYVSSSSETVDIFNDKDRKNKPPRSMARLIINSINGPDSLGPGGILEKLENLIQSIETFFHPSNNGPWSRNITILVNMLVDYFLVRWNRQLNSESLIGPDRDLTPEIKDRFVLALRDVTFLGIHSKNGTAVHYSLSALQGLAYLSPDLIIPLVLKEVYPSLQGLVETHRTMSSLKAISCLTRIISRMPRYRIHLTTLLTLALPGIDANDLGKTLHSLTFIQTVALNIPFYDLSESVGGPGLAHDYISADVASLETYNGDLNTLLPIDEDILESITKSSTAGFSEFIYSFLGKLFTLLENLPDPSASKSRDLPEAHVVNVLPPTLTALLGAVSPELYELITHKFIDFVQNHVIYPATDAMAHICGCLVKGNPQLTIPQILPAVMGAIKQEILENNAGSTRSSSEILPRDRGLIWYLSILNMSVVYGNESLLPFSDELQELTFFLRQNCKGALYQICNLVHHIVVSLVSISIVDYSILKPAQRQVRDTQGAVKEGQKLCDDVTLENWGEKHDPQNLNIDWYVPQRTGVKFAVSLFEKHVQLSIASLRDFISLKQSSEEPTEKASATEFSDMVTRHVTYMRVACSSIALLVDPNNAGGKPYSPYGSAKTPLLAKKTISSPSDDLMDIDEDGTDDISSQSSMSGSEGDDEDGVEGGHHGGPDDSDDDDNESIEYELLGGFADLDASNFDDDYDFDNDVSEMKKFRDYPCGWFFAQMTPEERESDPIYITIHTLRTEIAQILHDVHEYLCQHRENDISSFKTVLSGYKSWFADVGIERTAKHADILLSLYAYDIKNFKVSGLRKDYPRPILIRRANVYHNERIIHNSGPRALTNFDRMLIADVLKSSVSIYPDIRRSGQLSLESIVKVALRARPLILPWILKDIQTSLEANDYLQAESGLRVINLRVIMTGLKKDYKYIVQYANILTMSIKADNEKLNLIAHGLANSLTSILRLPANHCFMNMATFDLIKPADMTGIADKIAKINHKRTLKRAFAESCLYKLESQLRINSTDSHWKVAAINASLLIAVNTSIGFNTPAETMNVLAMGTLEAHPSVKSIFTHGIFRLCFKIFGNAVNKYDYERMFKGGDLSVDYKYVNSAPTPGEFDNYTPRFMAEMAKESGFDYFVDKGRSFGWLCWPERLFAEKVTYENPMELNDNDRQALQALGATATPEWFEKNIEFLLLEGKSEEDYFSHTNALFFAIMLRLMEMNFINTDLEVFLALVEKAFKPDDNQSHRCVSELCAAILLSVKFSSEANNDLKIHFVTDLFKRVVNESLSPQNLEYWKTFIFWSLQLIDYRRILPIVQFLTSFKLSAGSNAAFKESARLQLTKFVLRSVGWSYNQANLGDILDDLWANIDHSYQGVRDEIGHTLMVIYKSRNYMGFCSVADFLAENKRVGNLGVSASHMDDELLARIVDAFDRLEAWRKHELIQLTSASSSTSLSSVATTTSAAVFDSLSSSYLSGAKTLLVWLDDMFKSSYATSLIPLFPKTIIPMLLNLLNIRDDPEIMLNSVLIFRQLGNIPCPPENLPSLIDTIVDIGIKSTTWHQRMSILSFVQALFFRQLFMMTQSQRTSLIDCVTQMLNDTQLEVRENAATTLSGMIRCIPQSQRAQLIAKLEKEFTQSLVVSKLPARNSTTKATTTASLASKRQANLEFNAISIKRHAAVLGLGSLIHAFPYQSPPPKWVPKILAILARKAANDPGMVGKSVKSVLGEFKKVRHDTWHIDSKEFTQEELEDLEGVLWKNYFV